MQTFTALADPTRRKIVELLAEKEMSAGDIVELFDVSAPAISQHLKVLRDASLVKVRVEGQKRMHSLDVSGIRELEVWLNHMKRFWNLQLDRLEKELRADLSSSTPKAKPVISPRAPRQKP